METRTNGKVKKRRPFCQSPEKKAGLIFITLMDFIFIYASYINPHLFSGDCWVALWCDGGGALRERPAQVLFLLVAKAQACSSYTHISNQRWPGRCRDTLIGQRREEKECESHPHSQLHCHPLLSLNSGLCVCVYECVSTLRFAASTHSR